MECFQKGPKATVGRVQFLEAPLGGSRCPGSPRGAGKPASTAVVGDPQPSEVWGMTLCSAAPKGTCLEVWEVGWLTLLLLKS